MTRLVLAMAALAAVHLPAHAECTATVTKSVAALEDPSVTIDPDDDFGSPTQLQVLPGEQTSFVCAHGGYCYPSAAITLKGCAIVPDPDPSATGGPADTVIFLLRSE